jgi:hypothetical protein
MMMMRCVAFILWGLFVSLTFSTSPAQIRLNEILADPASDWDGDGGVDARGDEWVEIMNVGGAPVDLDSYRLGDTSGRFVWRYAFSGVLGPGEVRVVYGSDAIDWQKGSGYPLFGLSLNNSGDTVFLYTIQGTDTAAVDQYGYAAFEVADDRSVGRQPDGTGSWVIHDALNPYGGSVPPPGTGCNPSPGVLSACITVLEKATWGTVKSSYSR